MYDYYLKFTDEVEAATELAKYIKNEQVSVNIIGTARKVIGYEADGETPIVQTYEGFFVNIRSRVALNFDASYIQTPVTPFSVFAGDI
jgi:hypothetical protein